ncbi:MAG: hypothetical protein LBE86_14710 [Gemmobacter sp.]|nr:hypothetical protein [Gemmobacter sp.]
MIIELESAKANQQRFYSSGYRDGKRDLLREMEKILLAVATVAVEDETRRLMTSMAKIVSYLSDDGDDEGAVQ